jgi:hypothetical protein
MYRTKKTKSNNLIIYQFLLTPYLHLRLLSWPMAAFRHLIKEDLKHHQLYKQSHKLQK